MGVPKRLSLLLLTWATLAADGQSIADVPCETPSGEYGLCTNFRTCSYLINLLVQNKLDPKIRTFLKSSQCGVVGRDPYVCCPQQRPRTEPAPAEGTAAPGGGAYELPRPPHCGKGNVSIPRIVNGLPARLGEFPFIVALGYRNRNNPELPKWLCGGTLITERHVLTAAHCVHNRNDLYLARLGDLDLFDDDDGARPLNVPLVKAKIHEQFSPVQFTNDIAILTLGEYENRPDLAMPACLPLDDIIRKKNLVTNRAYVAGWGAVRFNGPSSSKLMKVGLPVQPIALCQAAYGNRSVIDDRVLCVGNLQGGHDACQGDSGGPLMISNLAGNKFFVMGVVSYGFRCAEAGYPGIYTKITTFLPWIENNLN